MFKDKVCVITGAANGIGKAIAEAFHKEGANIAFIDTDQEGGTKFLAEISREDNNHFFFHGDVGNEEDLKSFTKEIIRRFEKIDYIINNACYSNKGLLSGCSYEEFNEVLRVGITATIFFSDVT